MADELEGIVKRLRRIETILWVIMAAVGILTIAILGALSTPSH